MFRLIILASASLLALASIKVSALEQLAENIPELSTYYEKNLIKYRSRRYGGRYGRDKLYLYGSADDRYRRFHRYVNRSNVDDVHRRVREVHQYFRLNGTASKAAVLNLTNAQRLRKVTQILEATRFDAEKLRSNQIILGKVQLNTQTNAKVKQHISVKGG